MTATYVNEVTEALDKLIPGQDPALLRLYALLVLTEGVNTGRREVHDAWSLWKLGDGWGYGPVKDNAAKLTPYLVPFEDLSEEIAAYDDEYVDAIREVARTLNLQPEPGAGGKPVPPHRGLPPRPPDADDHQRLASFRHARGDRK